jgi:hypothetical protein
MPRGSTEKSAEFFDYLPGGVPLWAEIEVLLIVDRQDEVALQFSILGAAVSQHNISDHI